MKHTLKRLPQSQVLITLEVTPEEVEKFRKKAIDKLRNKVKVPGFREGKAPDDMVMQQVGQAAFDEEVLRTGLPEWYFEVVTAEKLAPIAPPESNVVSALPLVIEITVSVLPEVKVGAYQKIKVKPQPFAVKDEEITEELTTLQKRFAIYNDVTRVAKLGDRVEMDFVGSREGKPVEGASSKNHPLVLGSHTFIPGFEEQIVGMTVGDKKQFTITFPADYHVADLKGQDVTFDVDLKKVEEMVLPEMNDEFFAKLKNPAISSLESLKAEIRSYLVNTKDVDERNRQEQDIITQLIAVTTVDLPEVLLHEEVHYMEESFGERLQAMGMTMERYLEANKKTHEDLHKDWEPEAAKRLTARFALLEVAKAEKLEPTDAEVAATMKQEGIEEKDAARYQGQVNARLRVEKALDYLMKSALQ
ncbi:trigger factor [Candidatus Gracilibacteria bacterium]|nr:trigger factor [Candidatus Gracilibacteria bacterium]